jgi:oligoribonuclease NrnB/cAMP/cGMP phosphodiesterase (DHH superfamily)
MKRLKSEDIDIVIYHHPCMDGFTSALIVWKLMGVSVEYCGRYYNSPKALPDYEGKNVLMLDLCLDTETMMDMIEKCKNFLIIDHHESALLKLKDVPDVNKIFDMNESGASLTWKYMFPTFEMPLLIRYVRDRDLYKFEMKNSRAFSARLKETDMKFGTYNCLFDNDNIIISIMEGKKILRENNITIKNILKNSYTNTHIINGKETKVCYVETNELVSELGEALQIKHTDCDFAAVVCKNTRNNTTKFCLRSNNENVNVRCVAELYSGGGGHPGASGFRVDGDYKYLPKN